MTTDNSEEDDVFAYPFRRFLVVISSAMAVFSIVFAFIFLEDATPVALAGVQIHPIFFFLLFTSLFTVIIFFLKLRIYSETEDDDAMENILLQGENRKPKRRWGTLFVLVLAVGALFLPLLFSVLLDPLWSLIAICGFVAAFNIPEIILYVYASQHGKRSG